MHAVHVEYQKDSCKHVNQTFKDLTSQTKRLCVCVFSRLGSHLFLFSLLPLSVRSLCFIPVASARTMGLAVIEDPCFEPWWLSKTIGAVLFNFETLYPNGKQPRRIIIEAFGLSSIKTINRVQLKDDDSREVIMQVVFHNENARKMALTRSLLSRIPRSCHFCSPSQAKTVLLAAETLRSAQGGTSRKARGRHHIFSQNVVSLVGERIRRRHSSRGCRGRDGRGDGRVWRNRCNSGRWELSHPYRKRRKSISENVQ